MDCFVSNWESLLSAGIGVIFVAELESRIVGTIGGVRHADMVSPKMILQETHWYTLQEHRGIGLRLYRAFEQWAKENGCDEIRMGFLVDSMPDKVELFYLRAGFRKVEVSYSKRLV